MSWPTRTEEEPAQGEADTYESGGLGTHQALHAGITIRAKFLDGAEGVLITIAGSEDLKLQEVNEAARVITERADDNAEIIFGHLVDDTLGDAVEVTVVAAGFGPRPNRRLSEMENGDDGSGGDGLPDFIRG